jgi:hypothetical protein
LLHRIHQDRPVPGLTPAEAGAGVSTQIAAPATPDAPAGSNALYLRMMAAVEQGDLDALAAAGWDTLTALGAAEAAVSQLRAALHNMTALAARAARA